MIRNSAITHFNDLTSILIYYKSQLPEINCILLQAMYRIGYYAPTGILFVIW